MPPTITAPELFDQLTAEQPIALQLDHVADSGHLLVLASRQEVTLSKLLPVIHGLGATVVDERTIEGQLDDGTPARRYELGLRIPPAASTTTMPVRFTDAFAACWRGDAEVDGLNALIISTGLTWWDVAVLRAYLRYAQQLGTKHTPASVERIMVDHPDLVTELLGLFRHRFDPTLADEQRSAGAEALKRSIGGRLDAIASLEVDQLFRQLLTLVLSTVRTNAYVVADRAEPVLALKLHPRTVLGMPEPAPAREIWVYAPTVEGVHLRFGAIARGGLRWSDRFDDFRTEVLGLVKAQEVKNAVIVPVGAKGGFVVKGAPAPTGNPAADRAVNAAAGRDRYRRFIGALLDVVDNRTGGVTVTPAGQVRHDDDDTYLVVAADKGTATFSDLANEIALDRGFWLGDAFASGGSAGYDHKAMGITARGAWESVRYHFAELGHDVDTDPFTAIGIGDMSGDVFGNGMLLSPALRLVAAFDHRHIFIDPDPTPAAFAERKRLYALAGSSWDSYDRTLLSAGGGVWPRTAKSIPVSEPLRTSLGLADDVAVLTPPELIQNILRAPVDLLWNGGVGTYIKSSTQAHAEVGDKANDGVRVDADQLRTRVIGEGGNLGCTQQARIEFARRGGRIRTDAVDNSAGVDTSDHEVNLKIALDLAVTRGELSPAERGALLRAMTDEVAAAVLADNVAQNRVIAVAQAEATADLPTHARMLDHLERAGRIRRRLDILPSPGELATRGEGLTSPELCVLLAHVKSELTAAVAESSLPALELVRTRAARYFPAAVRDRFPRIITDHPLHDEIASTLLANTVINHGGLTYSFRLAEETGTPLAETVAAYLVTTGIFDLPALWQRIWDPATAMPPQARHELVDASRRLLDRASRWFLTRRTQPMDVAAELDRYADVVADLLPRLSDWLRPAEQAAVAADADNLIALGAPHELALAVAQSLYAYPLLDVADVAAAAGRPADEIGELYFAVSDELQFVPVLNAISALPRDNHWRTLARRALRDDVHLTMRAITAQVTQAAGPESARSGLDRWRDHRNNEIASVRRTHRQIFLTSASSDLAALSVLSAELRRLAETGTA